MEGWISIHRKILENPLFYNRDLCQFWLYLLLQCNHENTSWIYNLEKILIKRGQCVISQRKVAEILKQNISKINRMIKYLKSETQIETRTDKQFTLITITNYNQYQPKEKHLLIHKENTNETQLKTNNNDKNEENNNINIITQGEVEKKLEVKKEYGNKFINLVNSKFKEIYGFEPTDKMGRRATWAFIQRLKGKLKEKSDNSLTRGIDVYFEWAEEQESLKNVKTIDSLRRNIDVFYADIKR